MPYLGKLDARLIRSVPKFIAMHERLHNHKNRSITTFFFINHNQLQTVKFKAQAKAPECQILLPI